MNYHLVVDAPDSGMELDHFLCQSFPLLSRQFLRQQMRGGRVRVNGAIVTTAHRLRLDEIVSVDLDEAEAERVKPKVKLPEIPVLYRSEHILAVDKPANLISEGDRWDPNRPHLLGVLRELYGEDEPERLRLLHRLDKDTSGVILLARTVDGERALRSAFDERTIRKTYLALVDGEYPLDDEGVDELDAPLGPDRKKSGAMWVDREGGKPALTRVSIEERFRGFTLLRCWPVTGRTHQVRVHLAAGGFPLAVDPLYGHRKTLVLSEIKQGYRPKKGRAEPPLIDRLSLHALRIEFPDPDGTDSIGVESPRPRDLVRALKQLAKVRPPRR